MAPMGFEPHIRSTCIKFYELYTNPVQIPKWPRWDLNPRHLDYTEILTDFVKADEGFHHLKSPVL